MTFKSKFYIDKINEYEREVGVEIGVRDAFSSNEVISRTTIKKLYGIDIADSGNGRKLEEEAEARSPVIQGKSPDMSDMFNNDSLDFVFVDGDHSYKGCKADIEAWWSKLKKGGVMSGDDYGHTYNPAEGRYGVVEAVEEFAKENNLKCTVFYNDYIAETKEQRDFIAEKVGYLIELGHLRKKREYEIPELDITYDTTILPPLWLLEK